MKRILVLFLALLAALVPALAESPSLPVEATEIPENRSVSADIDGDGRMEAIRWQMVPDEGDELLTLTVSAADGKALEYPTDIRWGGRAYLADLDGDGAREILICGDEMSSDYVTYCLRLTDGALYEVLFPDGSRGDNGNGYYKCGYGAIAGLRGNRLVLYGSQDVLGTWFAGRAVTLTPSGHFEFADDGLWVRNLDDWDSDDLWEYATLTVKAPLAYTGAEGGDGGTLQPGDRILIYASDKRERAWFTTRDGSCGVLAISPDYERGWGWLVDGTSEIECFESLPYAD